MPAAPKRGTQGEARGGAVSIEYYINMSQATYISIIAFLLATQLYAFIKILTLNKKIALVEATAKTEIALIHSSARNEIERANKDAKNEILLIKKESIQRIESEAARAKNEGLIIGSAGNYPDFSLQISPYFYYERDSGWFRSELRIKTGVKYQLFMNGLVVGGPFIDVREDKIEKKVNEENVEKMINAGAAFALAMAKAAWEESRKNCPNSKLTPLNDSQTEAISNSPD